MTKQDGTFNEVARCTHRDSYEYRGGSAVFSEGKICSEFGLRWFHFSASVIEIIILIKQVSIIESKSLCQTSLVEKCPTEFHAKR